MDQSMTLLNADIGFLDTHLALIHIPLSVYSHFVQPIIQLLLQRPSPDEEKDVSSPSKPWQYWHPFTNVSITAHECSIVCPRRQADDLFVPVMESMETHNQAKISISREDFSVIMIGGEGLEAGQRVLDLTGPLAMAGIPIFFITSYWSDFILVPLTTRSKVIHALEERGFAFEQENNGHGGSMHNVSSPLHSHQRNSSSNSSFDFPSSPGTPPPTSVSELQVKTFKLLKRHNISPHVDESVELVTCAGMKDSTSSTSAANFTEGKIHLGLVKSLTSLPAPRFLSVTLTDTESVSLTLETRLLANFYKEGEDVLLGKDGPTQVPITFDLSELPLESTGIVCGVASRLIDGMKGKLGEEMFNMSYLSTTKTGNVIVYDEELDKALEALKGFEANGVSGHVD